MAYAARTFSFALSKRGSDEESWLVGVVVSGWSACVRSVIESLSADKGTWSLSDSDIVFPCSLCAGYALLYLLST